MTTRIGHLFWGGRKWCVNPPPTGKAGIFHKGDHRKCFAYETPTVSDRRSYMLEAEITPGNVHDSVAFDTLFERLTIYYPEVKVVTADAGYKTPWICKQIFDSERIPSLPYKQSMSNKINRLGICFINITTVSYTCRTRS